jgi:hypothetical protein
VATLGLRPWPQRNMRHFSRAGRRLCSQCAPPFELDRVQGIGYLDLGVAFPFDLDGQTRGTKIRQPEPVVTDVAVVVCSDVATPAIRCLELPLNEEVGAVQPGRIGGSIAGIFGFEQDLAVITGLGGGDACRMKSHDDGCAPAGFDPVTPGPRCEVVPSSQCPGPSRIFRDREHRRQRPQGRRSNRRSSERGQRRRVPGALARAGRDWIFCITNIDGQSFRDTLIRWTSASIPASEPKP